MNDELVTILHKKVLRYHTTKSTKRKNRLRNEIFFKVQPYMLKWLYEILLKKGIYLSKQDMTTSSWECFVFCLDNYKCDGNIPIPNHFYKYSNYFTSKTIIKENKKYESTNNELNNIPSSIKHNELVENIMEIKEFRNTLPENYMLVFDDALMSLNPHTGDRLNRMSESKLPQQRYQESKKVFKWFINFLLKRIV